MTDATVPIPIGVARAAQPQTQPLAQLVDHARTRRRRTRVWRWAIAGLALVALVGAWRTFRPRPVPLAARFRAQPVTRGDLVREVRASGSLEAIKTVQVGAQTSGRIAAVNVDYNDRVSAGQVLAEFDLAPLRAQLSQAQATLQATRWSLEQAKSDNDKAQRDVARAEELWKRRIVSDADHDTAVNTAHVSAQRVTATESQVAAQEAATNVIRTNLDYAVIKAPIDGLIITRNVDPGQTVASGFQTPVLFSLAADLHKMRVVVPVDQADIGDVRRGQPVTFTVDAYPNRVFRGAVTKVRKSPVTVQEVVTYGAEVEVDNVDLALNPGMTAAARIRTAFVPNAIRVPAASLRFIPPGELKPHRPMIWMLQGSALQPVIVEPGISDGEFTEIVSGAPAVEAPVLVELTPEGRKAYGTTR